MVSFGDPPPRFAVISLVVWLDACDFYHLFTFLAIRPEQLIILLPLPCRALPGNNADPVHMYS